jgi:hypothetical protein
MTDIDEQRKKVEELKRKILEQKKKGEAAPPLDSSINKTANEAKGPTTPVQSQAQEIKQSTSNRGSKRQNRESCSPATRRREAAHRSRKNHTSSTYSSGCFFASICGNS